MEAKMILIAKIVSIDCNLKCDYCFYHQRSQNNNRLMSYDTLETLIKEGCDHSPICIQFIWHGGEPLLAGLEFFEKIIEFQNKYRKNGQNIVNRVQTNGTLIDEKWAKFFHSNRFRIGISLDGPKNLHNIFRKYPDKDGSFDATWQGIQTLKQNYVVPGIIAVINSVNVKFPQEMFEFFINSELKNLVFNPAMVKDDISGFPTGMVAEPMDYSNFINKIFDLWLERDDSKTEIRQIKSIIHALIGGKYRSCRFKSECQKYPTIEYNGDIFPCDSEAQSKSICFGNIEQGLGYIFSSEIYKEYEKKIQQIRTGCLNCQWYKICHGGCTRDYYSKPRELPKNYFCDGLKNTYEYISESLKFYGILLS